MHRSVCSSHKVIQFIIESNKLALQKPNNSTYLTTHKACSFTVEVNIVKTLHKSYPEGIKVKASKGYFPFHLSITSLPKLDYLHDFFDEGIETLDKRGRNLTHVASEKGSLNDHTLFAIKTNSVNVFIQRHTIRHYLLLCRKISNSSIKSRSLSDAASLSGHFQ